MALTWKEGDTDTEGEVLSWAFTITECNGNCKSKTVKHLSLSVKTTSTTLNVFIMKSSLKSTRKCLSFPRSQIEPLQSWKDLP